MDYNDECELRSEYESELYHDHMDKFREEWQDEIGYIGLTENEYPFEEWLSN